ncbi:hypothetical protein FJ365_04005 [Candidatus Dependentiae bacterium]|nr:hypothetical protein [Candidatus Dependentiae bacterium]
MQHFTTIIILTILHASSLYSNQTTVLSSEDLAAASIPTLTVFDAQLVTAPADITFATADLKYNHGQFKIIECGNGPTSSAATHPLFINNNHHVLIGPYWDIVEHILKGYSIPVFFVGRAPFNPFEHFTEHKRLPTMEALTTSLSGNTNAIKKPKKIHEHRGIILYRASDRNKQKINAFDKCKVEHPDYLLINANSNAYFFGKNTSYKLFEEAGLSNYIPRYAIYPAEYANNLAKRIKHDLGGEKKYIIKPLAQTFALGVGLTSAENLDAYLKHMFGDGSVAECDASSIGYWRKKKESHFLISEFVPSQPIVHNNKTYEPTMRIIFLMTHEEGKITISITGGIWKIPPTDLYDETASLTDRYITNPTRMLEKARILIEKEDLKTMKKVVAPILAQLYKTLLTKQLTEQD